MFLAIHPPQPSDGLTEALLSCGYQPVPVGKADELQALAPTEGWRALVIELEPDIEPGLGFADDARVAAPDLPILVCANRTQIADLEAADSLDDFVLSPYDRTELRVRLARLGVVDADDSADIVRYRDLELNTATYQATIGGQPIDLTYMEYELLMFFVTKPGRVWSREQLLSRVWGYDYFGGSRTVDVHVRRLRAKLGEERAPWITTVRSVGYRFG
ncbi:MAG: response regulator transcription factor [Acidimicrobiia bacterium]|nr:response regulator transcription factor [Acidimicrobiia bacterium]NNC75724.1 response regulator transcription factor [Acidimicrobiia bacterium]